jgi:hypothetical protein
MRWTGESFPKYPKHTTPLYTAGEESTVYRVSYCQSQVRPLEFNAYMLLSLEPT